MNKEKDVLVPMNPEQYEYWKKGLNNIENELKDKIDELKDKIDELNDKDIDNKEIISDLRKQLLIFEELFESDKTTFNKIVMEVYNRKNNDYVFDPREHIRLDIKLPIMDLLKSTTHKYYYYFTDYYKDILINNMKKQLADQIERFLDVYENRKKEDIKELIEQKAELIEQQKELKNLMRLQKDQNENIQKFDRIPKWITNLFN